MAPHTVAVPTPSHPAPHVGRALLPTPRTTASSGLQVLELATDEAGCDLVRRDHAALRAAGVAVADEVAGVRVAAAPTLGADVLERAVSGLVAHLPATVRTSGIALVGRDRVSLVRLLALPDALGDAVLDLRAGVASEAHIGWRAHLVVARGLVGDDICRAAAAIVATQASVRLVGVRHRDPATGIVTTL